MLIEKIKNELIEQKKSKFKGNIYHYSQVNFAYHSNKIEGGHIKMKLKKYLKLILLFLKVMT